MDIREPLSAAVRALKANKLRSALTTLGIIIGVAAVIVVVSLVQGLKTSVLKQVEKAGSQTLFVRPIFPGEVPPEEFARIVRHQHRTRRERCGRYPKIRLTDHRAFALQFRANTHVLLHRR